FADTITLGFVEGSEPARHIADLRRRAIGGEVENVNADVAQRAVRAVRLGKPPQPLRPRAPVAPGLGDEPALQIRGFDVTYGADPAGKNEVTRGVDFRHVAIAQIDHGHD